MINNFAKERQQFLTICTCVNEISHIRCARRAQCYVRTLRTYVRLEKCDPLLYTNIRLSTNDQLIFLPSAKRGVDKKLHNSASKGSTELNNHLKMFRRFTLWVTDQGFKVLRPSVFELLATPFFRTRNFGRKMEKSTLYRKFA